MNRLIAATLLLFATAAAATAGDAGYVLGKGGYYWRYGQPYSLYRTTSYRTTYDCYGRYSSEPYYTYDYRPATDYQADAPTLDPDEPVAIGKLLDLAKQTNEAELVIKKRMANHNIFLETADKLGLAGNFRLQTGAVPYANPFRPFGGYGYGSGYGSGYGAATPFLGNYGASGNTQYGYSFSTATDAYGTTDLNAIYQQAAQLAKNAQTLAGQANGDFIDTVKLTGDQAARVAEINAKARAAALALQAAPSATPQVKTETRQFSFGTMPPAPPVGPDPLPQVGPQTFQAQPPAGRLDDARWQAAAGKCVGCHGGARHDGGFDVATFPYLSREQQMKVLGRLTHADPAKRMPLRPPDNSPGEPLSQEEIVEFIKRLH